MKTNPQPQYSNHFRDAPVLITGGAGFIGSHLVERLLELGASLRVIDDLSTGKRSNLPGDEVTFIESSILDEASLGRAMEGCRYVFHQAAFISVPLSVEKPSECFEINVIGTEKVIRAARDAGVQRMMFAATSAAYGESTTLPSREDQEPDCCSPYAASKVAGEAMLTAFSHSYGISTVALRYFNVFGPRQDPKSAYAAAISAFGEALINGHRPTIFGDGKQTRDFVYIANVVHANLLAASSDKPLGGDVFNVGMGEHVSLLEILHQMGELLKIDVDPVFEEPRAGDVRHSLADVSRTRDQFGYEPIVSFEDGLQLTLEWMKTQST